MQGHIKSIQGRCFSEGQTCPWRQVYAFQGQLMPALQACSHQGCLKIYALRMHTPPEEHMPPTDVPLRLPKSRAARANLQTRLGRRASTTRTSPVRLYPGQMIGAKNTILVNYIQIHLLRLQSCFHPKFEIKLVSISNYLNDPSHITCIYCDKLFLENFTRIF